MYYFDKIHMEKQINNKQSDVKKTNSKDNICFKRHVKATNEVDELKKTVKELITNIKILNEKTVNLLEENKQNEKLIKFVDSNKNEIDILKESFENYVKISSKQIDELGKEIYKINTSQAKSVANEKIIIKNKTIGEQVRPNETCIQCGKNSNHSNKFCPLKTLCNKKGCFNKHFIVDCPYKKLCTKKGCSDKHFIADCKK